MEVTPTTAVASAKVTSTTTPPEIPIPAARESEYPLGVPLKFSLDGIVQNYPGNTSVPYSSGLSPPTPPQNHPHHIQQSPNAPKTYMPPPSKLLAHDHRRWRPRKRMSTRNVATRP
ncbi:hypothetical protein BDW59DRAFT_159127 [Aspergillus cavernicola]|uniref:Uncharacterized protein n=1 Tax=Aspergillus cavernicola TaxID=176166 RepID=A0ABR4IP52_9EURO